VLLGKDSSLVARVASGAKAWFRRNDYPGPPRRPKVVSHRGDVRQAPENTRAACEAAVTAGADGVELDLCMTRDGVLVLWHDVDPDTLISIYRQAAAEKPLFVPYGPRLGSELRRPMTELSFADVREHFCYLAAEDLLDVARASGERCSVETLNEVVPWLASSPLKSVMLDIKLRAQDVEQVEPLVERLAELANEHPALLARDVHLLSVQCEVFRALQRAVDQRRELHALKLTADFELPGVVRTARELGARHVGIGATVRRLWPAVRDEIANAIRARQQGLLDSVTVWTIEDPHSLAELARLGVDAVLTDDVPLARRIFDEVTASGMFSNA
jgi:glycerophosphoryl diester phosphodiesterase